MRKGYIVRKGYIGPMITTPIPGIIRLLGLLAACSCWGAAHSANIPMHLSSGSYRYDSPDQEPLFYGYEKTRRHCDLLWASNQEGSNITAFLQGDVDVCCRNEDGWTPLHLVAFWGNYAAAELLLAHQARPLIDLKTLKGQETALDIAQRMEHTAIITLIQTYTKEPTRPQAPPTGKPAQEERGSRQGAAAHTETSPTRTHRPSNNPASIGNDSAPPASQQVATSDSPQGWPNKYLAGPLLFLVAIALLATSQRYPKAAKASNPQDRKSQPEEATPQPDTDLPPGEECPKGALEQEQKMPEPSLQQAAEEALGEAPSSPSAQLPPEQEEGSKPAPPYPSAPSTPGL